MLGVEIDFSNIPGPQVWFCHIQWTTVDHGWRVLDYEYNMEYNIE